MNSSAPFIPDAYQAAIYTAFTQRNQHIFVNAVAGGGKTTTLQYLMESMPQETLALSLAFSKRVQVELDRRIPDFIESRTINSFGYSILRQNGIVKMDQWKVGKIVQEEYRYKSKLWKEGIKQVVSLSKNTLSKDYKKLIQTYNIELSGANLKEVENAVNKILELDKKMALDDGTMDFDDQLWLPLVLDLEIPQYEVVFIDETQDLNNAQIEMVLRVVGDWGRVVAVGDPFQSVFAFRGANPESIYLLVDRLTKTKRGCEVMPLSISYRCSKSVTRLAQELVPAMECSEQAVEGIVSHIDEAALKKFLASKTADYFKAKNGVRRLMILCRSNSPLVEWQAYLRGLDLPVSYRSNLLVSQMQNLLAVHSSYQKLPIQKACQNIASYARKAAATFHSALGKEAFLDTIRTLISLIERVPPSPSRVKHYSAIEKEIKTAFAKSNIADDADEDCILLSTAHGAKGLEAESVVIVRPELMPHPKAETALEITQEKNIKYVAITRSRNKLTFIKTAKKRKSPSFRAFFEN